MNSLEAIQERYDKGYSIFKQIYTLSDKDLIAKLKSILGCFNDAIDLLDAKPVVKRSIVNEEPECINIIFYDVIKIDWSGISYKTEYGTEKNMVRFDNHFKL